MATYHQSLSHKSLHPTLIQNIAEIKKQLGNSMDLIIRDFHVGIAEKYHLSLIYIDGLINTNALQRLLNSLLFDTRIAPIDPKPADIILFLKSYALAAGDVKETENFAMLLQNLLNEHAILLADHSSRALSINIPGWEKRAINEPTTELVIRGSKESFSDDLLTNISLLRRRIRQPNLRIQNDQLGQISQTQIALVYLEDLVNKKVLQTLKKRLSSIHIDAVFDSGNIEELLREKTITPFPTMNYSERPDTIAANILEGRIGIIVDGTPFVLTAPTVFAEFFQMADDYYQNYFFSVVRTIRYLAFFLTLLAPSIYIALTTFHQEMLPTTLIISLAAQREAIPFPAFVEALIMEITFEILREAGIRMPRAVGPAVSIVGALVLGQAAVEAGLVSPAMVIVVSLTAIASFLLPSVTMSIPIRLLRFPLMALAASFGFFGIFIGLMLLLLHLCHLKSFGIPYLYPFSPFDQEGMKDSLLRFPLKKIIFHPKGISKTTDPRLKGNRR